jgi:hypothetical protein
VCKVPWEYVCGKERTLLPSFIFHFLQVRSDDGGICDKLAAEGILLRKEPLKYEMSSKFIWTIVLNAYAPYARNIQTKNIFFENGDINARKLIEYVSIATSMYMLLIALNRQCLHNFDAESIKRAASHSTKTAEVGTTLLKPGSMIFFFFFFTFPLHHFLTKFRVKMRTMCK